VLEYCGSQCWKIWTHNLWLIAHKIRNTKAVHEFMSFFPHHFPAAALHIYTSWEVMKILNYQKVVYQ
jgi:hypothetical protein